ncbi:MAG: tetratricopeptide repeat protein [Thermoflexales bacterium]|nr:tetratricopeptide repeat protein [Thermoflexales bacterium]
MLHVKLLGQFNLSSDDQPIELQSRPAQALLAYLILNAGTAIRREKLAGLLWPDASDANSRSNLRHALWRIRKAIGGEYLNADDLAIAFNAEAPYQLDVEALDYNTRSNPSTEGLMACVSVYAGEFLPGFYEDWIALERERWQATFERKMELLIERLIAERRWRETLEWAEHWIAQGQVPESAYRALLAAHYHLGNTAGIAAVYQRCAEALRKELDVEPSEPTRALYKQLSQGRSPYGAPDIQAPIEAANPIEPAAPVVPRVIPHNLPPQATAFVGRTRELAEIDDRLRGDPACRLLNIAGPGGIGKTRLALEAAQQHLSEFADGVFFVPLAPISAAHLIAPAIAQALNLPVPWQADPRTQLLSYLSDKHLLLVVDNFEHLLDGVDLLADILTAAPQVKVLATSRERLHLQWEWIVEIRGLDYPASATDPSALDTSAVRLFAQTARRMDARFALEADRAEVIGICQLMEGSPLGIELAAAWVRVLTCQEIVQQIARNLDLLATSASDRPERHRSLRAAFEYSWDLLSADEQKAFKKLAVFQGGFRREAAEKVAGAPLSLLFTLVDKSLLRRGHAGRFEMHSLLRQYITEKLNAGQIDEALNTTPMDLTRMRMAQYYLVYARQHQAEFAVLDEDWINLMSGLETAHGLEMWRVVLDYAAVLREAGSALGHFSDLRRCGAWAIDAAGAQQDVQAQAATWRSWGRACIEQADYDEARTYLERSLDLYRELDDQSNLAGVQSELARVAIELADYAEAKRLLATSQVMLESLPDGCPLAEVRYRQSVVAFYERDFETANQLAQQVFEVQQAANDRANGILTLLLLADIALHGWGDTERAEQYCWQAVGWCDALRNDTDRASALYILAEVHRLQGKIALAYDEAAHSLGLFRQMGDRKSQAKALYRLSQLDADRGELESARKNATLGLALCRQLQDGWGTIYVTHLLGQVYDRLGQRAEAQALWTEAVALAEPLAHPLLATLRELTA